MLDVHVDACICRSSPGALSCLWSRVRRRHGVAELVDACALVRAFDGLRVAERAFLVGVPMDDDPVLEFAFAEADQVIDRMRGRCRVEVDEVESMRSESMALPTAVISGASTVTPFTTLR